MLKILMESPDPPRGAALAAHTALRRGAASELTALLRSGVTLDCRDGDGHSLAARAMRIDRSSALNSDGGSAWTELVAQRVTQIPAQLGAWMLLWGAEQNRKGLVETLLSKGVPASAELSGAPHEELSQGEPTYWWPGGTALHFTNGTSIQLVRKLLRQGVSPNAVNKLHQTPLHVAAAKDDEALSILLIDSGSDIQKRDGTGKTALMVAGPKTRRVLLERTSGIAPSDIASLIHHAACHGDERLLKSLLEKGGDPNAASQNYQSPLFRLASECRSQSEWTRSYSRKCIELLLSHGADVGIRGWHGRTVLHWFVQNGDPTVVENLLSAGADPNQADDDGQTPLMSASTPAMADLLISRGALLSATDNFGQSVADHMAIFQRLDLTEWLKLSKAQPSTTALLIAAIIGRREEEACRLINSHVATLQTQSAVSPLHWAARYHLPAVVHALLDLGIDINSRTRDGDTPLGQCLSVSGLDAMDFDNWEETTNALLDRGASVVSVDSKGNPAIFVGTRVWLLAVADRLIHACVGTRNFAGKTVLMVASECGSAQHMRGILKHGVALEEFDQKGRTALFECCRTRRDPLEKAAMLVDAGASPDARDIAGETPLFEAARSGVVAVLRYLIDATADVNAVNLKGETPLFIAAQNNLPDNVACLLQAGARAEIPNHDGTRAIDAALQCQNPDTINLLLNR